MADEKEKKLTFYNSRANEYLQDGVKANELLQKAIRKAEEKQITGSSVWQQLQLLIGLFRDYKSGAYREIPKRSITMVVMAILYFVAPIDAIIDVIPGAGFLDDATVVGLVIAQLKGDLSRYQTWREGK